MWKDKKNKIPRPLETFELSDGGTHIFRFTQMCHSNWSLIHKKYLHMGPVTSKIIPKCGSGFIYESKFWGVHHMKVTNGPIFQEKSVRKWV